MKAAPLDHNTLALTTQKLGSYFIIILLTLIAYSNCFDNGFLYDDEYLILKNQYLHDWHSLGSIFLNYVNSGAFRFGQFYRPLQNVAYLVIYQIGGESLFGFHCLNIGMHTINACLVFNLGQRLGFHPRATLLAALLWALHPLATEAVTYMSATADVMFVTFTLAALVALVPDFSRKSIALSAGFFILALLSKETAIIFPLLACICLYLVNPQRRKPKVYLATLPFWALALVYILARFLIVPFHGQEFLADGDISHYYASHVLVRLMTFAATTPSYLGLVMAPVGLHMDRDFSVYLEPWFWPVLAGSGIFALAAIYVYKANDPRTFPLAWGLLWFFGAQFPQSGILVPVNALFLEHWMYLPTIGLFLGAAASAERWLAVPQARTALGIGAFVIILAAGMLTYRQNEVWHDPFVFYTNILDHGERSVRAHNNLGIAYMNRGDYHLAMDQFQLALKNPIQVAETHQDIAALLAKNYDGHNHIDEEIDHMKQALAINPHFLPACDGLADLYEYRGDTAQAEHYRQQAAAIRNHYNP